MLCSESRSDILQKIHDVENVLREARQNAEHRDAVVDTCFRQSYSDRKLPLILNCNSTLEIDSSRTGTLSCPRISPVRLTILISYDNPPNVSLRSTFEKQEMLVRNIEIVKGPDNRITPSGVSVVWLYGGNHAIKQGFASGVYFNAVKDSFEGFSTIPHREFGVFREFVGQTSIPHFLFEVGVSSRMIEPTPVFMRL